MVVSKCDQCEKLFNDMFALRRHQNVHTGEKPFPCRFCPMKFSQKGNRQSHEKKCKSKVWTPDKNNSAMFLLENAQILAENSNGDLWD